MEYRYELASGERPSEGVVAALAAVTGKSPLDLYPVGHVIDTDALDTLLTENGSKSPDEVAFRYAGWIITITATEIRVHTPLTDVNLDCCRCD